MQTLISNGLRERVILRVDGGFKSGVDVLMAAAMGADEYGFGSVAMIATGCVMARICHTNNCPVGVASQVLGGTHLPSKKTYFTLLTNILLPNYFNFFQFPLKNSTCYILSLYLSARRTTCSFSWCTR